MRAFKYTRPEDSHYLDEKSLLLGSFAHFSSLEDGRRDDLEGAVQRNIDVQFDDLSTEQERRDVESLRTIDIPPAQFFGCRHINDYPMLVSAAG